ncbi:MAG: hypothetical protein R3F54_17985 [Alphaproteobacteria bacterium]
MKPSLPILAMMLIGGASTLQAGTERWGTEQVYSGKSKESVWQAVIASLEANDIPVVASDFEHGRIRATQSDYLDERWAACPNLDRRDVDPLAPANLGTRSWPLYRGVDLQLEITGTETGTQLALDPRYYTVGRDYGRQRDLAVQVRCRSTGVLEHALFTAAGDN